MSLVLNETLIVDNRPGGGSQIGTMVVARSNADGGTVLFTNISFSTLPLTDTNVRYDPINSFAPIGLVATLSGAALVVRPSLPVKSLEELVTYARAPRSTFVWQLGGWERTLLTCRIARRPMR
jgi:tripartite-type tricarboxylate transporter receptor subunit TctC